MNEYFTKKKLINFENKIANLFNSAKIRAPVHLHSGNEISLLKSLKKLKKMIGYFVVGDHIIIVLLKGVPEKLVLKEIIKGKSSYLCFPKYKIYSSAIVGGVVL